MQEKFTFEAFYNLFIDHHTNMKIRQSINQLFYGKSTLYGNDYITQTQCTKIRKDGIKPGSRLYKDYINSTNPNERVNFIKGLNLYGIPDSSYILDQLADYQIPEHLKQTVAAEPDICVSLSKLLVFLMVTQSQLESSNVAETCLSYNNQIHRIANHYDFLNHIIQNAPEKCTIAMAFPAGTSFFYRREEVCILQKLLEKGYKIQVLVNGNDSTFPFYEHIRQPGRIYEPQEKILLLWEQKMLNTNRQITIRKSTVPLFHRMYLCYDSGTFAMGHINYYSYGSGQSVISHTYQKNTEGYTELKSEFDYLWNTCSYGYDDDSTGFFPSHSKDYFQNIHSENDFFDACMKHGNISRVRMEFHAGWYWSTDQKKVEILHELCSQNIPIEVLVNTAATCRHMASHMRNKLINYPNIDDEIALWNQKTKMYPNISLKVCRLPILHRYFSVLFSGGFEISAIKEYHYMTVEEMSLEQIRTLSPENPEFQTLKGEYDYLWNGCDQNGCLSIPYADVYK